MFRWVKLISFADILTLANGLIGFLAIIFIFNSSSASPDNAKMYLYIATMLIFLAMLVDGLDGAVARYFGTKHTMGKTLDSISDSVSFCIAPAVMLYVTYYQPSNGLDLINIIAVIASLLVMGFGILRLARFTRKGFKFKNFSGIPTPATTFFVFTACQVFGKAPPFINYQPIIVLPISIAIAFLMILDVQYPKVRPRGRNLIIVAILVALMAGPVSLAWFIDTPLYYLMIKWVVLSTFVAIVIYLLFGPLYVKLRKMADKTDNSENKFISKEKPGEV